MKLLAYFSVVLAGLAFSLPLKCQQMHDLELLLDHAKLANAIYHDDNVDGWTKVNGHHDHDIVTGLHWAVYEKSLRYGRFERALVFAGTEGAPPDFNLVKLWSDFLNDLFQGANMTPTAWQYRKAAQVAETEFKELPAGTSLVVIGHSLGGSLAQFAAAFIGVRAVSFNGALLSAESLHEIVEHWIADPVLRITLPAERFLNLGRPYPAMARIEDQLLNAVGQNMLDVEMDGEVLQIQRILRLFGWRPLGRSVIYEPLSGTPANAISLHNMPAVISAIESDEQPDSSANSIDSFREIDWPKVRDDLAEALGKGRSQTADWLLANAELYAGDTTTAAVDFAKLGDGTNADSCRHWAESLIAVRGESLSGLLLLGDALVRAGKYQEALATFDRGLSMRPADVSGLNARASLYTLLNQLSAAQSDFHKAFPSVYARCGGEDQPPCAPPARFACRDGTAPPCTCGQGHPCPPSAQSPPPPCPPQVCGGSGAGDASPPLPHRNNARELVANSGPPCPDGFRPPCGRGGVAMSKAVDTGRRDLDFSGQSGSPLPPRMSDTGSGLNKPTLIYSNLVFKR